MDGTRLKIPEIAEASIEMELLEHRGELRLKIPEIAEASIDFSCFRNQLAVPPQDS